MRKQMIHRHVRVIHLIPSNYRRPVPCIFEEKMMGNSGQQNRAHQILALWVARKTKSMKTLREKHISKTFIKKSYGDTKSGCVV